MSVIRVTPAFDRQRHGLPEGPTGLDRWGLDLVDQLVHRRLDDLLLVDDGLRHQRVDRVVKDQMLDQDRAALADRRSRPRPA